MKTKAKTFLIKNSFILIILLMVLILHHPILDNISKSQLPFRMAPDTNLVLTILEWNMFAFLNDFNAIYHLNCLYPNAYITFYSHPLYGESIIFLLLNKLLGINITNSYTIYLLLGFWIGAIGTFLLTRELTQNHLAPFLAALIFIIYPFFRFSFTHLHIFSIFWIGFIIYYLIRFLKNSKIKDAVMAGFYIFIQGLFSIYHGFFFLAIFFPLFYLISVIYQNINFKNTIKLAIAILIFIILLAVVFSPFFTTIKHSGLERKLDYGSLITTSKIIRSCSQFYQTFKFSGATVLKLFPGFTVIFLVLMTLSGTTKKWIFFSVFILLALVIVFFLNLNGHILASNWIFFGAMLSALVIFFLRARDMKPEIKTLMIILFLFPLIFFKFSTIIPGIQFSIYGLLTNIIPPLNNFRFLYRGVLLVVPVLAALAAVGMPVITQKTGKKRYIIYGLVFLFIIFENGYIKKGSSGHFKFTPLKYSKIEKKNDKIILELPIFDHRTHHFLNNRYTINTLYHHNYYVNGRTAYRVHNTNTEVLDNTLLKKNFPDENSFLWLLQNYSVDYVIFNWRPKLIKKKEDYITRIKDLEYHCRIVDHSSEFLVLSLLEYYPVKEIQRRYSHFHLKNRKLSLEFKKPYSGKITMVIAQKKKKQEYDQITAQTRVVLDFPEIAPNINGTYIRVLFERPVELKEITLVK